MNYITLVEASLSEIFVATEESRYYLLCFKNTLRHVHIKVKNYHLTTLLLSLSESRLDTVFAFHTFSVTQFPIDCVLWIFMTNRQQVFIDDNVHIDKAI